MSKFILSNYIEPVFLKTNEMSCNGSTFKKNGKRYFISRNVTYFISKNTSALLFDKVYFPNRCYNIVMTDFYIASSILKRRKTIIPYISDDEIKAIMGHPATWQQICSFRQSRFKNQLLYILGKIPSKLCIAVVWCLGKYKKLI